MVCDIYDVTIIMTPRQKLEPAMESQNGLCLECWPNVAEPNVLLQCTSGAATEDGLPSSVSSWDEDITDVLLMCIKLTSTIYDDTSGTPTSDEYLLHSVHDQMQLLSSAVWGAPSNIYLKIIIKPGFLDEAAAEV